MGKEFGLLGSKIYLRLVSFSKPQHQDGSIAQFFDHLTKIRCHKVLTTKGVAPLQGLAIRSTAATRVASREFSSEGFVEHGQFMAVLDEDDHQIHVISCYFMFPVARSFRTKCKQEHY